jgi:hypothetical protein
VLTEPPATELADPVFAPPPWMNADAARRAGPPRPPPDPADPSAPAIRNRPTDAAALSPEPARIEAALSFATASMY